MRGHDLSFRVARLESNSLGGSYFDQQIPTSDQTTVTSTGLGAYRMVDLFFAFTHNNASAGTYTLQARVAAGTWRNIMSLTSEADATSSIIGRVTIANFNQTAPKIAAADFRRGGGQLDASDANNIANNGAGNSTSFVSWSEVWSEVRLNSSVASSIEGDTTDQRGLWLVRAYN